jgi:flagellar motor switch protein FliN/FliY
MEEEYNQINKADEGFAEALAQEVGFTPGEDIDLDSIKDVPIEISVVLGETKITIDQLLKMGNGSVIELNRKVGEPVDLFVNNRCVARGEVVVVDDKVGITMTEIIKNDKNDL